MQAPLKDRASETAEGDVTVHPWATDAEDLARQMGVNPELGLSHKAVLARRRRFGRNQIAEAAATPWFRIAVRQLRSFVVYLLIAGSVLSFALGDLLEGMAIVAVILINSAIGFVTELRAVRSTEALRKLGTRESNVRRGGTVQRIAAQAIVPGDVMLLEGGDIVTADARLLSASRLCADESTLTGESLPVHKTVEILPADTALPDRHNMVFKGSAVTKGSAEAIVVGTGIHTELGRITELVETVQDKQTPLERRIDQLGRIMVWLCVGLVLLIGALGALAGKPLGEMLKTAIALAVATVPEGLPIVATLALARGVQRMARRNALVEELSAVETLGSTNVILTDKTGTLTENRMAVTRIAFAGSGETSPVLSELGQTGSEEVRRSSLAQALLSQAALCTDAFIGTNGRGEETRVGDPTELALLDAARKLVPDQQERARRLPRLGVEAFDPDIKMMATFHQLEPAVRSIVKGAPEAVLQACQRVSTDAGEKPLDQASRARWQSLNESLGSEGLRLLAIAIRDSAEVPEHPYADLTLLGLVALSDPPRQDVPQAIAECQDAGITVVMVTGDQAPTAQSIATAVGITSEADAVPVMTGTELRELLCDPAPATSPQIAQTRIFARTEPVQKLGLLTALQEQGAVVAMIGDGVNDAPALRKADIGVAMGERGTQVAREAADMILQDDRFATIVVAIEQGRTIFRNIRSFVFYLLSCNLSEIITVGLASALNAPLPILPMQILFLNLVTDVFPALALGMGEASAGVMRKAPRPKEEALLTRKHWAALIGYGIVISAGVLASLFVARSVFGMDLRSAVTVSFLTLAGSQLVHVFNMASYRSGLLVNEVTRNPWIWAAIALCTALLVAAVYLPILSEVLATVEPGRQGWLLIGTLSLTPLFVGQSIRALQKWRQHVRQR